MDKISVIVPCYNEQESIPFFYKEICLVSEKMSNVAFEFIFIDDGSKDETLKILRELSKIDDRIRYISFSRNFGKESAILAGLKESNGDYVTLLDADLQDPPSLIIEMYNLINEQDNNYDCIATRRTTRKGEPIIRSFFARLFYKLINKISNTNIVDGARDFRFMTRQMTDAILEMCEYNRFSKGIFSWVGFNTKWLEYENAKRVAGKTTWSFWKLFLYSLDGIIAFSTAPLVVSSILGAVFCFISIIIILVIIAKTLIFGDAVGGWPSLACIILFVGGIQLLCTGIIGQYLSKTYLEVKKRPIYIIKENEKSK